MAEEEITLTPSFDEVNSIHDTTFAINAFNGINVTFSKDLFLGVKGVFQGSLFPTRIQHVQKDNQIIIEKQPQHNIELSLSRVFKYGAITAKTSNGSTEISVVGIPSPFVVAAGTYVTDYKEHLGSVSAIFRQPWSNITVDLRTTSFQVPNIHSISGFFGNPKVGAGLQYVQDPNQKSIVEALTLCGHFAGGDYLAHLKLSTSLYSFRVAKKINDNLLVGGQLRYIAEAKIPSFEASWIYKRDKYIVHSIVSSFGIVASELRKTIDEKYELAVSCSLNHILGDYSVGIGITL